MRLTQPCFCRFAKKLTAKNIGEAVPLSVLLTTCFRMRSDQTFWNSLGFRRLTKRLMHLWSQEAEAALDDVCTEKCPDPSNSKQAHPYQPSSRRKGNKSLKLTMVNRFLSRGAGYVSLKDERSLADLGLASENSKLGSITASEYTARLLIKTEEVVNSVMQRQRLRCLNFCFDAASFAGEQVEGLSLSFSVLEYDDNGNSNCCSTSLTELFVGCQSLH